MVTSVWTDATVPASYRRPFPIHSWKPTQTHLWNQKDTGMEGSRRQWGFTATECWASPSGNLSSFHLPWWLYLWKMGEVPRTKNLKSIVGEERWLEKLSSRSYCKVNEHDSTDHNEDSIDCGLWPRSRDLGSGCENVSLGEALQLVSTCP